VKRVEDQGIYDENDKLVLGKCTLCFRECMVNRFLESNGYCRTNAELNVASICIHRGEEPVISGRDGICNIFFAGCNLRCLYCQNHLISYRAEEFRNKIMDFNEVISQIISILKNGISSIGFVSPSHVVPQVKSIIKELNARGYKPITVYNTNGYDKPETIRSLSGLIDVYLPDYKYVTGAIASEYSGASDYPEMALKAIKEMYYQKGSTLRINESGRADNGLLIRHLVLPGHAEESKKVLYSIAEELSPGVHLSLMSQYQPTENVINHTSLGRSLYREEYESVVETMTALGFRNGWIQDMDSNINYTPDFSKENPFE
jgi:putative pyruvate formate lyase activating enzyme